MTLHIPAEYEAQLREAAVAAGFADVEQFVIYKLLGERRAPAAGHRQGGQWKGKMVIADDFDELPADLS